VAAYAFLGLARHALGDVEGARQAGAAALTRARALQHPFTLAFALSFSALLAILRQDPQATAAFASETLVLSREKRMGLWQMVAETVLAGEQLAAGDASVWPGLQQCLQIVRTRMAGMEDLYLLIAAHATERAARAGVCGWEAAREVALRGIAIADARQARYYLAGFLRLAALAAETTDTADTPEQAADYRRSARAVAEQQGAHGWLRDL
jgi:hypothetical protein